MNRQQVLANLETGMDSGWYDEKRSAYLYREISELEKGTPREALFRALSREAEGQADIYPRFGPTCEWDTAAGQAIVEAAGGLVVDRHGQSLRYNCRDGIVNEDFVVYGDRSRAWHTLL